jgi:large subunit ribosomal protein L11
MKKIVAKIKLHIPAGKANPSPPVGPALGQYQVDIMGFCKAFNAQTQKMEEMKVPVSITVFSDRSFKFEVGTYLTSDLLKKYAKLEKGSGQAGRAPVGQITRDVIRQIAEIKLKDLNTGDVEKAMRIIEGQAKSMGLIVM